MNRWIRGGTALALGFGITVLAVEIERRASDSGVPDGTTLGALDMEEHCRRAHGERARAVHPGIGAYGWQCWLVVDGLLTSYEIDGDQGCEVQYGRPAHAVVVNLDDPNGWSCVRGLAVGG